VDAVDEYPKAQRELLLGIVQSLSSLNMNSLHLLAVIRREADIQRVFADIRQVVGGFREAKVQGVRVRRDIEKYLVYRLRSTSFRNWNMEEKRDLVSTLASQADDMQVSNRFSGGILMCDLDFAWSRHS
jgi:hypothetical protein